jgi:hypothetical protein
MRQIRVSLAIIAVALLAAVPAYAGGSTLNTGYGSTPQNVAGAVAKISKPKAPSTIAVKTGGSTLPFTGLDLGLFGLAAAVLVGTGVAFRRIGRQNS